MKKALLTTIFRVPNFGSVLQAYATQSVVESIGYECRVLNYDHNKGEWAKMHGVKSGSLKNKIGRLLGLKPSHRKANKLDAFINSHLHLTQKYSSYSSIQKCEGNVYDAYIAGSDQIWNTIYTNCDPVFLLEYAGIAKKRISIASSFAVDQLEPKYEKQFQSQLGRFHGVSVREAHGLDICRSLGIPNPAQVLDPTLLLSAGQWNNLIGGGNSDESEPYILLYMWCYAFEPRPKIFEVLRYWQQKMGCRIVALEGYSDCQCEDARDLEILDATDSSIADFLHYFAHASMVVTSSFHGTAFAVNYGVPLVSVIPEGGDDRQYSLLDKLGLQACCLRTDEDVNGVNPYYDKVQEQVRLEELRTESLAWIRNVLA